MRFARHVISVLTLVLVVAMAACSQELLDAECDLVVLNETSCSLSVYVDGQEAFAVRAGSDRTLDDIGPGRHVLEALDGQGRLVQRRTIEVATGEDFYWTLDHC